MSKHCWTWSMAAVMSLGLWAVQAGNLYAQETTPSDNAAEVDAAKDRLDAAKENRADAREEVRDARQDLREARDFPWGLLGLIGLVGLVGLGKKEHRHETYTEGRRAAAV
jgi:hypothetical protein